MVPFSHRVELQALDGHSCPPVGVLRLEHGAEAPPAQVVQVRQLLVRNHRQSARQAADVHTARGSERFHQQTFIPRSIKVGQTPADSGTLSILVNTMRNGSHLLPKHRDCC